MNITNQSTPGLIADEINLNKTISGVEAFSPKQYSPEITSAFDKISQMSIGDQCPSLEIFKQAVGLQLMGVVANYDGFLKKFLKEYPKKRIKIKNYLVKQMTKMGKLIQWGELYLKRWLIN